MWTDFRVYWLLKMEKKRDGKREKRKRGKKELKRNLSIDS
jgi:hypothetical protein